ncbi:MAG: hypothetical protein IJ723_01935 [Ruminococcus sp.]|nr:hypothetical protein [Ruminococcus sp.]
MRPIDADALCAWLDDICYERGYYEKNTDYAEGFIEVSDMVKAAPTIEAEPVRHGQWIHHAGMNSKCSCCGRYFPVAEFEQRPFDVNFCIHCGAKMDGGISDDN